MSGAMRSREYLGFIRMLADYQFVAGAGERLFPDDVELELSKKTGYIRRIYRDGELLATLRPSDGYLTLTITAAKILKELTPGMSFKVRVSDEARPFILKGRDVFSRHVTECDKSIAPRQEVLVIDSAGELIAVGRALLSGSEMGVMRRGVAVRVREGLR